jgi:hypothetical protein
MQLSVVVWPWRRHVSRNVCLLMIKMKPKYLCCLNVLAGEIDGNLCVFFVVLVVPFPEISFTSAFKLTRTSTALPRINK